MERKRFRINVVAYAPPVTRVQFKAAPFLMLSFTSWWSLLHWHSRDIEGWDEGERQEGGCLSCRRPVTRSDFLTRFLTIQETDYTAAFVRNVSEMIP